jgi:hypothetical protein
LIRELKGTMEQMLIAMAEIVANSKRDEFD